ncbi:patatin family protein [Shewanella sp. CG12_big_fil_rev_8_21_14_0_65_47_15]|uniref:patatin-like phospholipase family protein n=1 Tax=Shewanella sp. CG12_big_fil_rev_8_21_14_0_65_47_15 TaxID=1975537 RepID=UPI000CB32182|nr:patatin family protein [Shewanella sp. CG12_big_fil_rev_8_21_14_0_65_47_15]PIW62939.1 MAG: patatin family protein [Shewanella sp. CG12_big_fil_rev_8_21_14_0_65_47_15]
MQDVALVLEGGGLRAIYTAGVLDAFLQQQLYFPYVIGVSAGAIYPASYVSRQFGRNLKIQQQYLRDKRYMGLRYLLATGNYVNTDFTYKRMAYELLPFDFKTFLTSGTEFKVGAFNCQTGQTDYFGMADFQEHDKLLNVLIASSSLPFMSKPSVINQHHYLDGGIGEPIPLAQSRKDGYARQVVILTQDQHYQKSAMKMNWLARKVYKRYPAVAHALSERHRVYNQALTELDQAVAANNTFVICPAAPLNLSRLDRNIDKVTVVYHQGLADGQAILPKLQAWLNTGAEVS